MARKPLTLRTAVLTTAAVAAGSTAGTLAEAVTAHLGYHVPGVGQLATTQPARHRETTRRVKSRSPVPATTGLTDAEPPVRR